MSKQFIVEMNDTEYCAIKATPEKYKTLAHKILDRGKPTKTGHWIRWYERKENNGYTENIPHCKCSECNTEYDSHTSQFIKYCNECGAKMVEPQKSEE